MNGCSQTFGWTNAKRASFSEAKKSESNSALARRIFELTNANNSDDPPAFLSPVPQPGNETLDA